MTNDIGPLLSGTRHRNVTVLLTRLLKSANFYPRVVRHLVKKNPFVTFRVSKTGVKMVEKEQTNKYMKELAKDDKYSILLPTYNEVENLPIIIWLIVKYMNAR